MCWWWYFLACVSCSDGDVRLSEKKDRFKDIAVVTPDLARAKAVTNLSMGGDLTYSSVRVLSNLNSAKEVRQYGARFLIAEKLPFFFGHLEKDVVRELEMRASLKRKGVRGRDDVRDVVKEHLVDAGQGLVGRAKGFIS